jgi:SAM-dependent methyltransferase
VPHWHFTMLNDLERNDAFEAAIASAVRGAHVLEIGAGSGLLAMMAARHGAKSVVACEMSAPLAAAAQKIVARNGLADRVSIVAKKSMQMEVGRDLAQKADVLIAEVFDVGLLGEGFVPSLVHARAELLAEAARLIPAKARIVAMLIECLELKNIHPIGSVSGFDLSDFNVFLKTGYEPIDLTGVSYEKLSEPFVVSELDFATLGLETVETELALTVTRTGACHAIAFWFELDFGGGSILSSYPDKRTSHWKQAVQFLEPDRLVQDGETISVGVLRTPNGYSFRLV